jgi:hypothetical protein
VIVYKFLEISEEIHETNSSAGSASPTEPQKGLSSQLMAALYRPTRVGRSLNESLTHAGANRLDLRSVIDITLCVIPYPGGVSYPESLGVSTTSRPRIPSKAAGLYV